MARTQEPIAVLGIGAMGHGMAASALRAGIPTIVWNRERGVTRDIAELGAEVAETVGPPPSDVGAEFGVASRRLVRGPPRGVVRRLSLRRLRQVLHRNRARVMGRESGG
jgi:6-phosphogluconate dehydrogenase-like protein